MTQVRKFKDVGPLHQTLLDLCPPDSDGQVSVAVLANWIGVSAYAVYKWIHDNKVPAQRVPGLVALQKEHFGEVRVAAAKLNPLFATPV